MNCDFFVTGAAQGIGYQCSRRILGGGGRVFMADIDIKKGPESKQELETEFGKGKVEFGKLDVTNQEEWRTAWEQAETFFGGQVEGFCNNAGIFHKTNWILMKEINLDGMLYGTMLAFEKMGVSRGGKGGVMVVTASMSSFMPGYETLEQNVYSVTKHGVLGLVRSLALPQVYEKDKIRTVGIAPWFVDTNLVRSNVEDASAIERKYKIRMLEPAEVGVAFERLVVEGRTGDMLSVMPDSNFLWPHWNKQFITAFYVSSKLARKIFGLPDSRLVTGGDMVNVVLLLGGALLTLLFFILHNLLNSLGI